MSADSAHAHTATASNAAGPDDRAVSHIALIARGVADAHLHAHARSQPDVHFCSHGHAFADGDAVPFTNAHAGGDHSAARAGGALLGLSRHATGRVPAH